MKFWNLLRWFALAVFFLLLVGLWAGESSNSDVDTDDDLVPAPKFFTNP
jgi:hypothetical protein